MSSFCALASAEVADAEDMAAFADASFDALTCCAGMMFLDHKQ